MAELDCAECGDGIDDLSADDVVAERVVAGIVRKTQFARHQRQIAARYSWNGLVVESCRRAGIIGKFTIWTPWLMGVNFTTSTQHMLPPRRAWLTLAYDL